ncbi:esterase [Spirosoma panaciterrae]|uniref:esterase n=1 Tax=Spirosoma panaciterrae TaxID=496058 RepID=UPI0003A19890|nr:esterase [Spirosoma panaciterrae]
MKSIPTLIFLLYVGLMGSSWAQQRPNPVVSPEILPDNSVIFRIKAPSAKSVRLFGTWLKDLRNTVEMTPKDSSVFEAKVGPLPADMYEYRFIVDGIPILDPVNTIATRDGSYIESRLMLPGPLTQLYDVQSVPHGVLSAVWYPSPTIGMDRRMEIYTPPGYEKSGKKYPVLYLFHGAGGDEEGWVSRGRTNYILDNLIAAGKAEPMIVVITNGVPSVAGAPGERPAFAKPATNGVQAMTSGKFEESLMKDVIPFVEANYRVMADPAHRAIAGLSMGGYHTQQITNANPGTFSYIGVMSMGLFDGPNARNYNRAEHIKQLNALKQAKPKLYWIGCGKDDFLFESVTKLRALYDQVGLPYTYRESDGGHTWVNWRLYLTELAPKLFR